MLEIKNVKVYDLQESVISCRNAMRLEMPSYDAEEFEKSLVRAKKLVQSSKNSHVKCHDNFLTGIRVSFDMKYTQYITKQFQRYHWFDFVSSSSLMHRITKMEFDKSCNKYVSQDAVDGMQGAVALYNAVAAEEIDFPVNFTFRDGSKVKADTRSESLYYMYMSIISNCPMGTELFVRVSTNYKQLQTIYNQRKNHKLKEDWGEFCNFVKSLPYADELIIGNKEE